MGSDPYKARLEKLADNFKRLDKRDPAYPVVKKALESPLLTMNDEWEIHEKLTHGGQDAGKAKERLKEAYIPLAVNTAFAYDYLGIPLIELIEAGVESLDFAVNSLIEVVDHPARLSFVMGEVVAHRIGILLDEMKIELVDPQELREMIQDGRRKEAEAIMCTLDPMEKKILEKRMNVDGEDLNPIESTETMQRVYANVLRKLRRPKTSF